MLRVVQQSNAIAPKSYYSKADYLSEGQELVGHWGGQGAERLGLAGPVGKERFDALCDNIDPRTRKRLTARTNGERTCGYDFTWSVPKSVSLLYGLTEDGKLLDAFRNSVDETMRDIEAEMQTRVRVGKQQANRLTGNAVWASFYHFTSRPIDGVPDPQMHAHCFVFNSTWDEKEQKWKAGQFRDLKGDAPYWQAAFRVRLANRLQEMGYAIERRRDDFEIASFSKNVLDRFSRRTAKIEQLAEKKGITDPEKKAKLGKATREKKNETLSWKQVRQQWRERLSNAEFDSILNLYGTRRGPVVPPRTEKLAVNHALSHCFVRDSVVTRRTLETEALKRGLGGVTLEGLQAELAGRDLIERPQELMSEGRGQSLVTTREVLAGERELARFAKDGRGTCPALAGIGRSISREWLSDEQKTAVRHIWESPDRVMLIRGAAGTGKTTMLQEAVEGIAASGRPVVALAQTAPASRDVLRGEAKIENANTVAHFLRNSDLQQAARGGVIIVDEISQIGVRSLLEVASKAEALDARLVVLGDPNQMKSVERGSVFQLLAEEAALPVVELKNIRRQSGAYRLAVQAMNAGRIGEGFDRLDSLGWMHELPDGEREATIARDYLAAMSERKKNGDAKSALVVTPSNAEAERITMAIRSALRQSGKLGEERAFATWTPTHYTDAERADATNYELGDMLQLHQHIPGAKSGSRIIVSEGMGVPIQFAERFQVYRPGTLAIAVGDRLRVTANSKSKDGRTLDNGLLLTVAGFTKQGDIVDEKGRIIGRDFGHLARGFAVTSFSSQGKTVDKVFIAQSAASGRAASAEQFYVSASRGRESAMIYVDDKAAVRAAIQEDRPRLSATELARQPTRPSRRALYLGFRRRQQMPERSEPISELQYAQPVREASYER